MRRKRLSKREREWASDLFASLAHRSIVGYNDDLLARMATLLEEILSTLETKQTYPFWRGSINVLLAEYEAKKGKK